MSNAASILAWGLRVLHYPRRKPFEDRTELTRPIPLHKLFLHPTLVLCSALSVLNRVRPPSLHQRPKFSVYRHATEKFNAAFLRHNFASAFREDVRNLPTAWTHESRHVFHHTQHRHARLDAEIQFLPHV